MVLGTLYDILVVQLKRQSSNADNDKEQPPKPPVTSKDGLSNGGFVREPEVGEITVDVTPNGAVADDTKTNIAAGFVPFVPQDVKPIDAKPDIIITRKEQEDRGIAVKRN